MTIFCQVNWPSASSRTCSLERSISPSRVTDQDISVGNLLAFGNFDARNHAGFWSTDGALHLHRFQSAKWVSAAHVSAGPDHNIQDRPRHGSRYHISIAVSYTHLTLPT